MRLNSRLSSAECAEPRLKYGVFNKTDPDTAHSIGPLVLRGRCENLGLASAGILAVVRNDLRLSRSLNDRKGRARYINKILN